MVKRLGKKIFKCLHEDEKYKIEFEDIHNDHILLMSVYTYMTFVKD